MLMSKSRLEKFLYALYSLDSSDLPNPLSRIEELYKCLVTGEELPTFEPLSRVEKYLMAILGVYNADELPNPLSRVEVLLYKLATGDDNLDDVRSFLSEHEELLAEIIRNGGVGGNIDIEYVLYTLSTEFNTLYNTAEKPVKSAILKGNTLVNIINNDNWSVSTDTRLFLQNISVKKGQIYSVIGKIETEDVCESGHIPVLRICAGTDSSGTTLCLIQQDDTVIKQTFINNENETIHIRFFNQKTNYKKLMIIEGDYTNVDIPYFEGMKSVQMPVLKTTGKNLFNKNNIIVDGYIISDGTLVYETGDNRNAADFIEVEPNCIYSIRGIKNSAINGGRTHQYVGMYDKNKKFISSATIYCLSDSATFTTTENTKYIRVSVRNDDINRLQIEKGTATTYEPHKSNILSASEDVELRGIGDVKDELNLLTGELTERIGEITFDGSDDENWWYAGESDTIIRCNVQINIKQKTQILCNNLPTDISNLGTEPYQYEGVANHFENYIYLYLKKEKIENYNNDLTNIDKLEVVKDWLSKNPIIIQYQLETESVKTVDLSAVDQDGNDTKLSTFEDITYVTLSSEGLIPEAELEVATKNEEVLNTMSLEMDDISASQTTLEETSNTQSENVDATMMATTEIYEQLL